MAHYLVKAEPLDAQKGELIQRIENRDFISLKPFGEALTYSLEHAKIDKKGTWIWEELDYCNPPLKQERAQVLDRYFSIEDITPVEENQGWSTIEDLPKALKTETEDV